MAITKTKRPALGGPTGYLTRFVCCLFQKKSEAASPPDETPSQVWDLQMSRRPSSPTGETIKFQSRIVCWQGPIMVG